MTSVADDVEPSPGPSDPDESEPPRAPETPRRRVRPWHVVVAIALLWGGWCGLQLLRARSDSLAGIATIEDARSTLTPESLLRGSGRSKLESARGNLMRAHDRVEGALLTPLRHLPWIGRQVRSLSALTGAAAELTDAGLDAMDHFDDVLDGSRNDPAARIALTGQVADVADATRERVLRLDLGPSNALLGALGEGRRKFAVARDRLDSELADLRTAALGLKSFLTGPSRYLLFAANNGEMRAGSGMFLTAGRLDVDQGTLAVGDFDPTAGLRLPAGEVDPDPDTAALWGFLGPSVEWRNLGLTPRFDATAELASRMWTARTGEQLDGVMVIDPVALQALLRATGPVDLDGTSIDSENIIQLLTVDQYRTVERTDSGEGMDWERYDDAMAQRRNRLSEIAHLVLDKVQAGEWDTATLLSEVSKASKARHILAWSPHPQQQEGWRAAGISGELDDTSMALSLLSQGGTKVDGWIGVEGDLVRKGSSYTLTVKIDNRTPEGLPSYVAGPSTHDDPNRGVPEGYYAGIVSLNVPGAATSLHIDGVDRPTTEGRDGPSRVVATRVKLARGEQHTLVFRFTLPEQQPIVVEPSARFDPIHWRYGGHEWWDLEPVVLDSTRPTT